MPDAGERTTDTDILPAVDTLLGHNAGTLGQVPRETLALLLAASGAVADRLAELDRATSYASVLRPTWAALAALAPEAIGQQAEVSPEDTGSHTDPQTSATVDNAGRYTAFGTEAGQWTWVDGGGLGSKLSVSARLSEFSGPFANEVRGNIGAASQEDLDAAEAVIATKADAAAVAASLEQKADTATLAGKASWAGIAQREGAGAFADRPVRGAIALSDADWNSGSGGVTWSVNAAGEIEVAATDTWSSQRFWDVGEYYTGGGARYELAMTIATNTSGVATGPSIVIGTATGSNIYCAYVSAVGGTSPQLRVIGRNLNLQDKMGFVPGDTVKLIVDISEDEIVTVTAVNANGETESFTAANVSVTAVPGRVCPGWRIATVTGTIHYLRRGDTLGPLRGINRVINPIGLLGPTGWYTVNGPTLAAMPEGEGFRLGHTGTSGIAATDVDVPAEASGTIGVHLRLPGGLSNTATSSVTLFLLQYNGGSGIDAAAEVARYQRANESDLEFAGAVFSANVALHPDATRVTLALAMTAPDGDEIAFTEACVNFSGEARYLPPPAAPAAQQSATATKVQALASRTAALEAAAAVSGTGFDEPLAGVAPPDGFSFDDYGFNIYRGLLTKRIVTDFAPTSKLIGEEVEFWVDPVGGNDADAGTEGLPFATLGRSISALNAAGVPGTLWLAPGEYLDASVGSLILPTQHVNLRSTHESQRAELVLGTLATGWTQDATYTNLWYVDVVGDTPVWAYDKAHLDAYGVPRPLPQASIGGANTVPGYCHVSGNRIYVHLRDGREPDGDVRILHDLPGLNLGAQRFYLERLNVFGGNSATGGVSCGNAAGDSCATECRFGYATQGNAFGADRDRAGRLFLHRSDACYSRMLDGWNYHAGSSGVSSDVVEIDCMGHHNGLGQSANNNGTTMHEGGRSIRINGDYSYNMNRNVHDINDGTQSWLLGCVAGDAQTSDPDAYDSSNFMFGRSGQSDATTAWLDGCRSRGGSVSDFAVYAGSELNVRDTDVTNLKANVTEGTLRAY